MHPKYEFVFLFDYSRGNDRGQENGLNAKQMNVIFSGKHTNMHKTLIKEEDV